MTGSVVAQRERSVASSGVTNIALSAGFTPSAGNHLLLVVFYSAGSEQTVTWPTAWGTPAELGNYFDDIDGYGMRWAHVENATAASSNGQCTFEAAVNFPGLYILESAGIATSGAYIASSNVARQVNPGTSAGAITASVNKGTSPAWLVGLSNSVTHQNWDTAVSDTGQSRIWDYGTGSSFSAKPQVASVSSTGTRAMTWTTSAGTGGAYYFTLVVALAEAEESAAEASGDGSFAADLVLAQDGDGIVANRKLLLTEAVGRELRDNNRQPVANLSGIKFEWYDKTTDTEGNPDVSGTFDTNESGEAIIPLFGSGLSAEDEGILILEHPTDDEVRGVYRLPVS